MNTMIAVQVRIVIKEMTDQEVLAQRIALLLGSAHEGRFGYEKIKSLLTLENGTKMHNETAAAFLSISEQRLGLS